MPAALALEVQPIPVVASTRSQRDLGAKLGVDLSSDTFHVAASKLREVLWPAIWPGWLSLQADKLAPPAEEQVTIAEALGMDLGDDSAHIAKARILEEVFADIEARLPFARMEPTSEMIAVAKGLNIDVSLDSRVVAYERIGRALLSSNLEAISRLSLRPGVRVLRGQEDVFGLAGYQPIYEVSSISSDGRVFFRGQGCPSAWARTLRLAPD